MNFAFRIFYSSSQAIDFNDMRHKHNVLNVNKVIKKSEKLACACATHDFFIVLSLLVLSLAQRKETKYKQKQTNVELTANERIHKFFSRTIFDEPTTEINFSHTNAVPINVFFINKLHSRNI